MTCRARWHDYRSRCIYMLTLSKRQGVRNFGHIVGDSSLKAGTEGACRIELSQTGKIVKNRIYNISTLEPAIRLLQYAVMPDHVHILLEVQRPMTEPLGLVIARMKAEINGLSGETVFEEGFNDQILHPNRSLPVLFDYLRDNPRRLAVRRDKPEFFRRVNGLELGDCLCTAYGNLFLLRNPFKEQVIVHRADSPDELARKRELWLYTASNGGVLVSPFISPAEKTVRTEAESVGARTILITHDSMTERYKPSDRDFSLCESGRLLIVSTDEGGELSRRTCLRMNALATIISENSNL